MDIFSWVQRLPSKGETVLSDRYWMGTGGKGANQAVAARLLGADVTFVARVGNDRFGQEMVASLAKIGIGIEHITVDEDCPSGMAIATVDSQGNNTVVVVPGSNMKLTSASVKEVESAIASADILLLQLEIPLETVACALEVGHRNRVRSILNPAPARRLDSSLLALVDILMPNETEAEMLTGIKIRDLEGVRRAALQLLELGVSAVIVTLGDGGAFLATTRQTKLVPAYQVRAVDTTGAGDAFAGGLAVALAEGKGLEESAQYANAVAAISVTRPGAQLSLPSRDEVENFVTAGGTHCLQLTF